MKVYVNGLGYLSGPFVSDATIEVEVSPEVRQQISNYPSTKIWQYDWETQTFSLVPTPYNAALRFARENECFSIINRGQGWYDNLTESQRKELQTWYQSWLDITETGVVPELPEWLKQ